ncbi:MAG TPA: hypothetical protein PK573_07270 [Spirochaetota bacterium]|nr:hypothetical protein [Spirochaetota bacterium]HRZ25845.1 hypothetical protein [Spirochaetota bacterium]
MSFSINKGAAGLCLAAGILACSPAGFNTTAQLPGTWQQTGRKCPADGECSVRETSLTLTIRPDGKVILRSGGHSGEFLLAGEAFYRIYSPDRRLAFSFEVLSLTRKKMTILLYNHNMQKQDTYSFNRIADIGGI